MLNQIKELREKTGAGMADVKKALDESGGDMDKAVEILRKKGIAKAAKRGDREASEGIIKMALSDDKKEAYIIEVSAETDFVARNDKFQSFVDNVLELAKKEKPAGLDSLLNMPMGDTTVKDTLGTLSGTIGEKMEVKNFETLKSQGTLEAYSHMDGRIGVLVALDKPGQEELAHDIAMQVAAADPKFLEPSEVPQIEVDKEMEIYREQLKKEGKPENIIDKILEGKIGKYYEEVCLLNQEYIKDDKKKVKDIMGDAKIEKFIRLSLA